MEGPKEVVLVTGASSGFGRSLVESLAQNGYQVLASMREASGRNATANAELRSLAEKEGLSLQVVELDVTNEESVDAAVKEVVSWAGRIDVLVNNAGVAYRGATEAFTVEQVRELFDVNFFGVLRMNRAVLPYMRKQGRGLLILMSSAGGQVVYPFMGLYSASKFAAEAMSISYRYDLSRFGIDSVIVQPGWHPTPILGKQVRPADVGRLTELEILSDIWKRMDDGVEGWFSGRELPDIKNVANVVEDLIRTPLGKRPLRVLVGQDVQYVIGLNEAADAAQAEILEMVGLSELMQIPYQDTTTS